MHIKPINLDEIIEDNALVEPGEYPAKISSSEVKDNKKGTGQVLGLHIVILSGKYAGQKVYDYLNIHHQNKVAENISRKKLKRLCQVVGVTGAFDNSAVLHGRPFTAIIDVEEGTNGYQPKNIIIDYLPAEAHSDSYQTPEAATIIDDDDIPF